MIRIPVNKEVLKRRQKVLDEIDAKLRLRRTFQSKNSISSLTQKDSIRFRVLNILNRMQKSFKFLN